MDRRADARRRKTEAGIVVVRGRTRAGHVGQEEERLTGDPELVDTGFDGGGLEGSTAGSEGQDADEQNFAGMFVDEGAGAEKLVLQP